MKRTGVNATEEQRKDLLALSKAARDAPCIAGGPDFASVAFRRLKKACHQAALDQGLPEIRGYYGMTEDGEFTTVTGEEQHADN